MEKQITIQEFLQMELNQISNSYVGYDNVCRCGCKGTYTATSFTQEPRSDVNDALVHKRLRKAKKLVMVGAEYQIGTNNINIVTGENRALTLYFDEIKK
jgi:hypothetical protein